MWNQKMCLELMRAPGYEAPEDVVKLYKSVGYDAFFTGWREGAPIQLFRKLADENGMDYQSVHAPWDHAAHMWGSDETLAEAGVQQLCSCLRDTAAAGVPIMIAHTFVGFHDTEHTPNDFGVECYGKVVREAERLGVKIAFENTEGEEYLGTLLNAFRGDPNVGFCWDTGHEMCYNHSQDLLKLYGSQLICTHLNDNLGIRDFGGDTTYIDDLHLLPFDGIADWNDIAGRLDAWNFAGPLTFELNRHSKPGRHENDVYAKMDFVDYITETYKRACRVAALRRGVTNR